MLGSSDEEYSRDFNDEFNEVMEGYSTEWHLLDAEEKVECRQLSLDTYELRSPTHLITLSHEGFALYLDNSEAGKIIFQDWCQRHNVMSELRTITDGT